LKLVSFTLKPVTYSAPLASLLFHSDDFLGSTSSSQLNFTPSLDSSSTLQPSTLTAPTGATLLSPVLSPSEEREATLSVSSDSVSLPTQVEVQPAPVATELTEKLAEATLKDVVETKDEQRPKKSDLEHEAAAEAVTQPEVPAEEEADLSSESPPPHQRRLTAGEKERGG